MTYREMAIKTLKCFGEELINRAEELLPDAKMVKSINVWIRIPTLSDDVTNLPDMEVQCEVYPKRETLNKVISIMRSRTL